jgi:beta-lactam-binding protein with PASTA domain
VAGASIATDSEVVVLVSSGPAEKTGPVLLPDIVGLTETDATARLHSAGLEPEIARDYHPNVAEGIVLAQLPSQAAAAGKPHRSLAWLWITLAILGVLILAGAAAAGYFLNAGKQVSVPNVVGQSQAQATQVLTAAHLRAGTVASKTDSTIAAGTVLEQNPQPGVEIDRDAAVNLVVSGQIPQARVPGVVGLNTSDAKTALEAAGFVVLTASHFSDSVPKDTVISQSPTPGTSAPKGSNVNIDISLGSSITNATLPDFTDMTQNAAVNKTVSLGLKARITQEYSATAPAGQVVDQIPTAGTSVALGTTIGLSISLGPAPATSVTVPDLSGQSSTSAESALRTLGLVPATVSWDSTGKPADSVVGQSPKAGEQVASGGSVVIFVSSGK